MADIPQALWQVAVLTLRATCGRISPLRVNGEMLQGWGYMYSKLDFEIGLKSQLQEASSNEAGLTNLCKETFDRLRANIADERLAISAWVCPFILHEKQKCQAQSYFALLNVTPYIATFSNSSHGRLV